MVEGATSRGRSIMTRYGSVVTATLSPRRAESSTDSILDIVSFTLLPKHMFRMASFLPTSRVMRWSVGMGNFSLCSSRYSSRALYAWPSP